MRQNRTSVRRSPELLIGLFVFVAPAPARATPAQTDNPCEAQVADDAYSEAAEAAQARDYRAAVLAAIDGLMGTRECSQTEAVRADLVRLLANVLEQHPQPTWDTMVLCGGTTAVRSYLEQKPVPTLQEQLDRVVERPEWQARCGSASALVEPGATSGPTAKPPTTAHPPGRPTPLRRAGVAALTVAGVSLGAGLVFFALVARDELERRDLGCEFKYCHEHWARGKRNTRIEFASFGIALGVGIVGALLLGIDARAHGRDADPRKRRSIGLTTEGLQVRF